MIASATEIEHAALGWLVQVNDPAFVGWEAWEAWLDADPRHADAYWRLAETEADMVEVLKSAALEARRRSLPRRSVFAFPRLAGIAAAVAAVAIGGVLTTWNNRPQPWSVETASGERRTITLADGSRVSLDGATRLTLDRRDPREATLNAGRALFEVVHDDRAPFRVDVGGATLVDLGTTFDVTRLQDGARVSVSEGRVRVDQGGDSATLNAGDKVIASSSGLERGSVSPEAVVGWRDGRLSWTNETYPVVAQDLERALGHPISLAPSLTARRFSGSLMARPSDTEIKGRVSRLLGVAVVEDGEGWRLEP